MNTKNPKWTRDELLIALDAYLKYRPKLPNSNSKEILKLSNTLKKLQQSLGGELPEKFRNLNGVHMKLMNFLRFDPSYKGKGLQRGNKDEEVVWKLYAETPDELKRIVKAITENLDSKNTIYKKSDPEEVMESEEGRILTRVHLYRERNSQIVKEKKKKVLKEMGLLACEVCGFNFASTYKDHGHGFIECHHTKPVSELLPDEKTSLNDLVLLCSNCHRMIHRKRPWLKVGELKELVR